MSGKGGERGGQGRFSSCGKAPLSVGTNCRLVLSQSEGKTVEAPQNLAVFSNQTNRVIVKMKQSFPEPST